MGVLVRKFQGSTREDAKAWISETLQEMPESDLGQEAQVFRQLLLVLNAILRDPADA